MSSTIVAEKTWPMIDQDFGDPFSLEITSAMSWARDCNAPERRLRPSARSSGIMRGHGPVSNAARAAAMALSMSAGDASGTVPMTSSVWGEMTSMTPLPSGFTHSPPMNNLSRTSTIAPLGSERFGPRISPGRYRTPDDPSEGNRTGCPCQGFLVVEVVDGLSTVVGPPAGGICST